MIVLMILGVILFSVAKESGPYVSSTINCILNNENYTYKMTYNEKNYKIKESGGDSYLINVLDLEKIDDFNVARDKIYNYFENNGGSCTIE